MGDDPEPIPERTQTVTVFVFNDPASPESPGQSLTARSYEDLREQLRAKFGCLRRGDFCVALREDGTLVCDDEYFQLLRPNTELLAVMDGAGGSASNTRISHYVYYYSKIIRSGKVNNYYE